jgi:hypothetical protein
VIKRYHYLVTFSNGETISRNSDRFYLFGWIVQSKGDLLHAVKGLAQTKRSAEEQVASMKGRAKKRGETVTFAAVAPVTRKDN